MNNPFFVEILQTQNSTPENEPQHFFSSKSHISSDFGISTDQTTNIPRSCIFHNDIVIELVIEGTTKLGDKVRLTLPNYSFLEFNI